VNLKWCLQLPGDQRHAGAAAWSARGTRAPADIDTAVLNAIHAGTAVHSAMHAGTEVHNAMHADTAVHKAMHPGTAVHNAMHADTAVHKAMHPGTAVHNAMHADTAIHKEMRAGTAVHNTMQAGTTVHDTMTYYMTKCMQTLQYRMHACRHCSAVHNATHADTALLTTIHTNRHCSAQGNTNRGCKFNANILNSLVGCVAPITKCPSTRCYNPKYRNPG
jgi:hypothetical protein